MADLRLPGIGGLELLTELQRRGVDLPVVIITGHGDVQTARAAFRSRAIDFLEKPFDDEGPVVAIEAAFLRENERLAARREEARRGEAVAALSEREKSVASLLVLGIHNREVGKKLGISPRTVEVHKARIMTKLGVRNIAELIRVMETKSQ
jgi:FixJ family two-component response regulator